MKALVTRLRIAGFKSFAEPVALEILPGLTGIVGPNGCGKSNVVEALRWAMGETSARSLRGGEMDDVIFAGTVARASRNLAEVTVTLEGELPEPFSAEAELTLTRRIERGAGSAFRANGRELRARDVQTLYADLASGARSSGMVSQGRVSALVSARPEDRRHVLEEAAGITGLHARRHEAELKLRAAEQNLSRAADLRAQLEAGAGNLRKQAKAAARYRTISGLIRNAEIDYLAILQGQAEAACRTAEADHASAAAAAGAAAQAVEQAGVALAAAEAAMDAPRSQEAAARSVLERRRVEVESLALETEQAARTLADAERRLQDMEADVADAIHRRDEAAAVCGRLAADASGLAEAIAAFPAAIDRAALNSAAAAGAEQMAAAAADAAAGAAIEAAVAARQAEQVQTAAAAALETARARHRHCRRDHDELLGKRIDSAVLDEAHGEVSATAAALILARQMFDSAVQVSNTAHAAHAAAASHARDQAADYATASQRVDETRRAVEAAGASFKQLAAAAAAAEASRLAAGTVETAAREALDAADAAADAEWAFETTEEAVRRAATDRDTAALQATEAASATARARGMAEEARRTLAGLTAESEAHAMLLAAAARALPDPAVIEAAKMRAAAADHRLEGCRLNLAGCHTRRNEAELTLAAARAAAALLAAEEQRLAAEAGGIEASLAGAQGQSHGSAIDQLDVPPGLEAAVAAALGDAADHALDAAAPRHWVTLPRLESAPLPAQGLALNALVAAPDALARSLSQAVVIEVADGDRVQRALRPGQVAVSRNGDSWRWDGAVTRAGAPTAGAARLQQRNRLAVVTEKAALARDEAAAAQSQVSGAEAAVRAAVAAAAEAAEAFETAQTDASASAAACSDVEAAALAATIRHQALFPTSSRLAEAIEEATRQLHRRSEAVLGLPAPRLADACLAGCEAQLISARTAWAAARDSRQTHRAAALATQEHARRISAQAEAAEQRAALIEPQLQRARRASDVAEEAAAHADAALRGLDHPRLSAAEADAALIASRAATTAAEAARRRLAEAELVADQARDRLQVLTAQHHQIETSLAGAASLLMQAAAEEAAADAALASAVSAQRALPDTVLLSAEADQARSRLADARQANIGAATYLKSLDADRDGSKTRQSGVASELAAWKMRLSEAHERAALLETRAGAVRLEASVAARGPAELRRRAELVQSAMADAEAGHDTAAMALAKADAGLRATGSSLRQADASEAAARAALARAEGTREASGGAREAVRARIAERLAQHGETVQAAMPVPSDLSEAAEDRARRRTERLARERDEMGPVNLRADLELAELDERSATLERECEEITAAIAKLRGAIGHINREGRARLTAVFTEVDRHFRILFTRTMGGGRAHLALTGSDDPLLAGLEIYAEPPGKKLSTLSLLSGGEQALTALSLIFAVFRCTPAPISVLDEVDAPLDDANVERFCALLDDVVRDTGTRFLVVTHHQLTMSRMDRLFGVTMQERGVSRLLSVDLQSATAMVEATLQAAE